MQPEIEEVDGVVIIKNKGNTVVVGRDDEHGGIHLSIIQNDGHWQMIGLNPHEGFAIGEALTKVSQEVAIQMENEQKGKTT